MREERELSPQQRRAHTIGYLIGAPECLFPGKVLLGSSEPLLDAVVINHARESLDVVIARFEESDHLRDLSSVLFSITDGILWGGLKQLEGLEIATESVDHCWLLTEEGRQIMEEVTKPWGTAEDVK